MSTSIEGFVFDQPPGFRTQDVTIAMTTGLPDTGPSPSLIVQSRPARAGADIETIAAETLAELLQTIPGMIQGTKGQITFDDGGKGMMLSYTMSSGKGPLRQYFVMRIHQGRVCTATLTAPLTSLSEGAAASMMKCLSSIRPG